MSISLDNAAQCLRVSGDLTIDAVPDYLEQSKALFNELTDLHIDLSAVTHSDSAGLALLIRWMREARASNKIIVFEQMPAQMLAMAEASGLDTILPLQTKRAL
ncbi:MAG TPA: STAS domain-containing protein [Methylophaga sp.]|nr:STAS domain-containing protein [Methylophaga sp.]